MQLQKDTEINYFVNKLCKSENFKTTDGSLKQLKSNM